jgi:hypothetical protein
VSRFRKLPIVVEAWQVASRTAAPEWLTEAMQRGDVRACDHRVDHLDIVTLEGTMRASPGDWIIQGVEGELYPCRIDIFAATYEPVE